MNIFRLSAEDAVILAEWEGYLSAIMEFSLDRNTRLKSMLRLYTRIEHHKQNSEYPITREILGVLQGLLLKSLQSKKEKTIKSYIEKFYQVSARARVGWESSDPRMKPCVSTFNFSLN